MTTTQRDVFDRMVEHHGTLLAGVAARVGALEDAVEAHRSADLPAADLVAFLADEVIPHAQAEEYSLYPAAATHAVLGGLIGPMVDDHRRLVAATESLAGATSGDDALAQAKGIEALFSTHVAKENTLLLPGLLEADDVDLALLMDAMHQRTAAPAVGSVTTSEVDLDGAVVSLLLEAAGELAAAGRSDRACQLVAATWVALRATRPDLAARATAHLLRLARGVVREPVALRPRPRSTGPTEQTVLDVRPLTPAQRHESIFATFEALLPGDGYLLVNDHDPKPLRYQFEAERAGTFTWDAVESGPDVWRVAITKTPDAALTTVPSTGDLASRELDVRALPHGRRHDIIFATYEGLRAGDQFVIVNDHDPKPLRYQFEAEHAGRFSWEYLEVGPTWRVRIGKAAATPAA